MRTFQEIVSLRHQRVTITCDSETVLHSSDVEHTVTVTGESGASLRMSQRGSHDMGGLTLAAVRFGASLEGSTLRPESPDVIDDKFRELVGAVQSYLFESSPVTLVGGERGTSLRASAKEVAEQAIVNYALACGWSVI